MTLPLLMLPVVNIDCHVVVLDRHVIRLPAHSSRRRWWITPLASLPASADRRVATKQSMSLYGHRLSRFARNNEILFSKLFQF